MLGYEELLELLGVEEPSEIQYFEDVAEIFESEEEIEEAAVARLLMEGDGESFAEILQEYFEEMLKGVPDSETELYTQLQTVGLSLSGMIRTAEGEQKAVFCDEFLRFRKWYTAEPCVRMREDGGEFDLLTPMDALTFVREERLSRDKNYEFDFEKALEYELRDYVVSFSDIAGLDSQEKAMSDYEAAEIDSPEALMEKIAKSGGGLPEGFVYDDEMVENEDR